MYVDPLTGIRFKIKRAEDELKGLDREIQAFLHRHPYGIDVEMHHKTREVIGRVRISELPNGMWSVIVGDIIHNLRSALDHLVFQLVLRNTGAPPADTNKTAFPIFLTEPLFDSKHSPMLNGVHPDVHAVIKRLQPFATGENEGSPLWHLHKLSNWDKHRDLPVAVGTSHRVRLKLDLTYAEYVTGKQPGWILEDNAPLFRMLLKPSTPNGYEVKVDANLAVHIALQQPRSVAGLDVVATVGAILNRAINVTRTIADRFLAEQ